MRHEILGRGDRHARAIRFQSQPVVPTGDSDDGIGFAGLPDGSFVLRRAISRNAVARDRSRSGNRIARSVVDALRRLVRDAIRRRIFSGGGTAQAFCGRADFRPDCERRAAILARPQLVAIRQSDRVLQWPLLGEEHFPASDRAAYPAVSRG